MQISSNKPHGFPNNGSPEAGARLLVWILRRVFLGAATVLVVLVQSHAARADAEFDRWREQLWWEAKTRGIKPAIFDRATIVQLDLKLPDLVIPGRPVKEQAEFVKLPADYLPRQQLVGLAKAGSRHLSNFRGLLERIEANYGVPGNVVIAIWGRETDYGAEVQGHPVFQALVTQAYLGRRKDLFRDELLIALELVQEGIISMDAMGSYTGAMGHTQFEPSDFLKFAVDGDGDGKIDLERSIPDALASAAKQLRDYGWQRAKRWGFEVRLPPGVGCVESSPAIKRPLAAWLELGVTPVDSAGAPADMLQDQAQLIMPAGIYGPAFLTFANFQAIRSYNQSDVYALFVGHLADLIAGGGPFEKPWAKLKPLHNSDVRDIQSLLAKGGYYADAVDGRLGTVSRQAIGKYQQVTGLNVDCWPSQTLLNSLRHAPGPKPSAAPASVKLPGPPAKRAAAPPTPAPQPKKKPKSSTAPAASR